MYHVSCTLIMHYRESTFPVSDLNKSGAVFFSIKFKIFIDIEFSAVIICVE